MAARPRRVRVDVDADARARIFHAFGWSLFAGVGMGAAVAYMAGPLAGVLSGLAVVAVGTGGALLVSEGAGAVVNRLHHPPVGERPAGLSRAEALRARGDAAGAAVELEILAGERPDKPDACILLARIQRDDLKDLDQAYRWFGEAIRRVEGTPLAQLLRRERTEMMDRDDLSPPGDASAS